VPVVADRVAAITGASSGIGEATALALAAKGYAVALGARRADRLDALAGRIRSEGGVAEAIEADVGDEASARRFVETARERLGRLDALVANAGVMLLGPVAGADTEHWRRMIDVNVYGVLYTTHAALPIWQEQGAGHLVVVSSVAGRVAGRGSGVYNLTKFGVNAFAEALRQETAGSGIRVSVVEPGAVDTELLSHNDETIQGIAAKRLEGVEQLTSEDIAATIAFCVTAPPRVGINELLVRPAGQR
jgi:NADP-dependent 3-hydroxy acid dehydrogenase YdfG